MRKNPEIDVLTFPFPLATEVLPTLLSLRSSCEISGQFICSNIYRLRTKQRPGKQNEPKSAVGGKKSESPKFKCTLPVIFHFNRHTKIWFLFSVMGRVMLFTSWCKRNYHDEQWLWMRGKTWDIANRQQKIHRTHRLVSEKQAYFPHPKTLDSLVTNTLKKIILSHFTCKKHDV